MSAMDLLDRPLAELPLVFFDTETTGLSFRRGDRVCEIALLRREPGGDEAMYESLIEPGRPISPAAFRVNKISPQLLKGAPRFSEVAPQIKQILEGAIGVAHNANFDIGFLRTEFLYLGQALLVPVHCIDTLKLARAFYRFPRNNLGELARAFGIQAEVMHRARADVETMQGVFDAMMRDLAAKGISTLRQLNVQMKRAARKKRRTKREAEAQAAALLVAPASELVAVPAPVGELQKVG